MTTAPAPQAADPNAGVLAAIDRLTAEVADLETQLAAAIAENTRLKEETP